MNELLLILVAFGTSMVTAVVGMGGGLILIAFMPGLLPAAAIIPVHAIVQLCSNSSRALFGWRFIRWEFSVAFVLGSVAGGLLASQLMSRIDLAYSPLIIAAYILFNVWGPKIEFKNSPRGEFLTIGFVQTGLGMMVGATGPLGQSTLLRKGLARDALVVTTAVLMTITHIVKITLFGLLGFSFFSYWKIIAGMSLGVILGAYIGTHLRYKVAETYFRPIVKWVLTLLALRIIYITIGR